MAENHTTDTTFSSLPIHEAIQEALEDHRLTHTTPIQEKTLPLTLSGHDVMGLAQTGTGKTATTTCSPPPSTPKPKDRGRSCWHRHANSPCKSKKTPIKSVPTPV